MNVGKIKHRTRTVEVEWDGETASLEINRGAFTFPLMQDLSRAGEDPSVAARFIATVVSEWDLTENKKPYPLTEEKILELPVDFLMAVVQTLSESVSPFEATRTKDDGSSGST
jgi:hypothetical protein